MGLRFLGSMSKHGECPSLYAIEENGKIVAQGEPLTDPEHLAQLRDVKESETFVVLPRELLTRFAPREIHMPATHQPSRRWMTSAQVRQPNAIVDATALTVFQAVHIVSSS
jgi:hypothetical protein